MDPKVYRDRVKQIDWTNLYETTDVNIANNIFE